jgi:hypothetical protein
VALLPLLDFFLEVRSVSEVEELESRFSFLPFDFLLLESADVELEVELESSLLELDSVELLELADVDDELLIPFLIFLSFFCLCCSSFSLFICSSSSLCNNCLLFSSTFSSSYSKSVWSQFSQFRSGLCVFFTTTVECSRLFNSSLLFNLELEL